MPRLRIRIPINQQDLLLNGNMNQFCDQPAASLSDMIFGFLEDGDGLSPTSSSSEDLDQSEALDLEVDGEKENNTDVEVDKNFWEQQCQLLQATLCRTSPLESRVRNITKEAIKEMKLAGTICECGRPMASGCRNCLMREVSRRLSTAGYNSAICKSKWRSSPGIPSGEHSFLDVVDNSSSTRGEVRIIIELHFRAEFEMAKASEEYNRLVRRLPEVFVGKVERLSTAIKTICSAAKKCMKEKKMHLGPWRKQRYMQAKWLGTFERTTALPPLSMAYSGRFPKPKASMLTVDLLELSPNIHFPAVEVV